MAKRDKGSKQTKTTAAASTADTTKPGDAMEQRVLAFAEQLGRIVGTVQARTEGWMDRETLNKQIAGVRDSAAELLDQLADGVTSMTRTREGCGHRRHAEGARQRPQRRYRRRTGQEAPQADADRPTRRGRRRQARDHAMRARRR